ncbi:hypothetical protein M3Y97_00265200 [Aphelenchoides bicaudatus]|nr:hypothetical protein M3Y97_00265200 [Aphelenchoides bicaudatus]
MRASRFVSTVLLLFVFFAHWIFSANARMSSWNSLSFGPDFEREWSDLGGSSSDQSAGDLKPAPRLPSKLLLGDKNGKLNRKNCNFSPVQCSFYFKRSMPRAARYY